MADSLNKFCQINTYSTGLMATLCSKYRLVGSFLVTDICLKCHSYLYLVNLLLFSSFLFVGNGKLYIDRIFEHNLGVTESLK
jgi:hypothetical protein